MSEPVLEPVHVDALAGVRDVDGRRYETHLAGGGGLPQPSPDLSIRTLVQRRAVHVPRTPCHRRACEHVLRDGMFHEAGRGDDLHALVYNALHTAEMIGMGMRVEHRLDGAITTVLSVQR